MAAPIEKDEKRKIKTSRHCCVPLCTSDSRYEPELHFHHIPKNEDLKKQWIIKIRRDEGPLFKVSTLQSFYFILNKCRYLARGTFSQNTSYQHDQYFPASQYTCNKSICQYFRITVNGTINKVLYIPHCAKPVLFIFILTEKQLKYYSIRYSLFE